MANVTKTYRDSEETEAQRANRDPITGAPGAHPVSTGVGALAGGVAGGAIGAAAGPVGAAIGAGVGAVAGGLAGKAVGEQIDPTVEDAYWRENYMNRPYVRTGDEYSAYQDAYRFGWESAGRYGDRNFDDLNDDLRREWEARRDAKMTWMQARQPAQDAWNRVRTARNSGQGSCGCT